MPSQASKCVIALHQLKRMTRIQMHPYISREDCFYTDTDSVVISEPLSDERVSASEIGKLKLEYEVLEGIFNAPKSSCLVQGKTGCLGTQRSC
jgi:hypothetical protein